MRAPSRGFCLLLIGFLLFLPKENCAQAQTTLVVTGSSMPEPLYKAWAEEYHKTNSAVQLRYLAVGTAESARNVLRGSGDFGGGDAPIPESELAASPTTVLQLPTVLIGIVVVYHLPQTPGDLKLTGRVLADIYLGKIKDWRDPAIAKLNQELKLPALPIQVFHRSAGKGSNYIFSSYLAKMSPEFLSAAGRGESPKWPVGREFQRSQDLAESVAETPGAIGYTELNLAEKASLRMALIQNAAGEFVKASSKSIAEAASAESGKQRDAFKTSLLNAPGKGSYPISSFTWLYVPATAKDPQRGVAVAGFLKWMYTSGQNVARDLGYATLPDEVLAAASAKAATIH